MFSVKLTPQSSFFAKDKIFIILGFVLYIKIVRCVRYDLEDVMAALKRRHGRNMSSDAIRV